ncbi:hypothetical protein LIER_22320 [Lithospermum erythrorhizon]|uniref:Uncharacterized protein n=1 Tax=Lithospermum erythrorhizon TaxID=34254 RepID=A0AAV3QWW0_LITER
MQDSCSATTVERERADAAEAQLAEMRLKLKELAGGMNFEALDTEATRMLEHKETIISHLSWDSLFLEFHTLGLYVHNDVMHAFGTPKKNIREPVNIGKTTIIINHPEVSAGNGAEHTV